MEPGDDLPECCGSGCTNCVLDCRSNLQPVRKSSDPPNVLDSSYKNFECTFIAQHTEDTFLFRFQSVAQCNSTQLIIPPGSHLMLRAARKWRDAHHMNELFSKWRIEAQNAIAQLSSARVQPKAVIKYDKNEQDLYFSRPYTPIRVDRVRKSFDILVKLEVAGEMSEYLTTIHVGDETEWKGVYTGFAWERNKQKNLVGFAHGVGLAPIYSIMANILDDEEDETRLSLHYCCKDVDNVLLRADLHALGVFWNFQSTVYLSREVCNCGQKSTRSCSCLSSKKKYNERMFNHRLEKIDIENLLVKMSRDSLQVLICGDVTFTTFVENCLLELNIRNYYKF